MGGNRETGSGGGVGAERDVVMQRQGVLTLDWMESNINSYLLTRKTTSIALHLKSHLTIQIV